jgi:NADH dehydrogenase FAD-containing subunit
MSNQDPVNSKLNRTMFGAKRRESDQLDAPTREVMRRTESALLQVKDSPSLHSTGGGSDQTTQDQLSDPAPSAAEIAEERAHQLVSNISSQMLGELRSLREQIDGLMRDMNERRDLIRDAIRSHAEFAETAIQHKVIIAESVAKLREEFDASRTLLPPGRTSNE